LHLFAAYELACCCLIAALPAAAVVCRLMLYCALTGQLMDKSLAAVKKHMQGKKFLRAKGEDVHIMKVMLVSWCTALSVNLRFWAVLR
jgi:hypothetical protein